MHVFLTYSPPLLLFLIYFALCLGLEQSSILNPQSSVLSPQSLVLSPCHPTLFTGLRLSVSAMCFRLVRRRAQLYLWHSV